MQVFCKVYYDRVYFLRAERIATGSGFQTPAAPPRPLESRVPPPPRGRHLPTKIWGEYPPPLWSKGLEKEEEKSTCQKINYQKIYTREGREAKAKMG